MNANYSEALEQQLRVLRFAEEELPAAAQTWASSHDVTNTDRYLAVTSVREGHTTYVSREIAQFVAVAARSYPNVGLCESDLPFSNGFAWFDGGLPLPNDPYDINKKMRLSAISWIRSSTQQFDGIVAVFWATRVETGRLCQSTLVYWNWGRGWGERSPVTGVQPPDSMGQFMTVPSRYLVTLFSFMQQRILVSVSTTAERHVRKRLARDSWDHEPVVRVIQLRRSEHLHDAKKPVEPVEREWSCQWVVRGHWRQQPYPKVGDVRPKWITPYVKGPDDKPLKPPRATVFAVVR